MVRLLSSERREIVMPIVRYIGWVGTSLLALLFVANWFLPKPPQEAAHEAVNAPVIRIASVQQPPEAVVIDTNQPTIIPPSIAPESAVPDAPSPLQSYASVESPPATIDVGQKNRKESKRQKAKVALEHKYTKVRWWTSNWKSGLSTLRSEQRIRLQVGIFKTRSHGVSHI